MLQVSHGFTLSLLAALPVGILRIDDPPTADAGPDQTVEENKVVTLSGSGVDPEGQALSFTWKQTAGPSVTLSDIHSTTPTFTAPEGLADTSVSFQLAVSDGSHTTLDAVRIDVDRDDDPPSASAGPDQSVKEADVVKLAGSGVDPEGQSLSFTWTQAAGPSVALSDIHSSAPTFTAPEGLNRISVTFQLAVSDGPNTAVDTVKIEIERDNDPPSPSAGPDQTVNENAVVTLAGAGVDPEGQTLTYTWTQTADPGVRLSDIHSRSPTFLAPEGVSNVSLTFQLAVSDGTNTAVDTVKIDVRCDNDAPKASAGPDQTVDENELVTLVGSGADPEGQPLTYTWTITTGAGIKLEDTRSPTTTFTAPEGLADLSVTLRLAVSDGTSAGFDTITILIHRNNDGPSASAGPDQTVDESEVVVLAGSGLDPEGQVLTYSWTQTAGPPVTLSDPHAATPKFTPPEGLTDTSVTLQLAVSDGANTSVDAVMIDVHGDNDAPTAVAGPDQTVNESDLVALSGSGVDPEGQVLTYTWTQTSGLPVVLSEIHSATPKFKAPEGLTNTSLAFQLSVSDGVNTNADAVRIEIRCDNDAPSALAGADQVVNENVVVTLAAAGADPEGQPLTYTWGQVAGASVRLSDLHSLAPTFTAPEGLTRGALMFRLAVSDGTNTSVDEVSIQIERDNDPPSASAGADQTVTENEVVKLIGSGTDPEAQALSCTWTQTAGPEVQLVDPHATSTTFTAPEGLTNTSVTLQLAVSDGTNTTVDAVRIAILSDDDPPSASAGVDLAVNENDIVRLAGSGVDPEGQPLSFTWTQTAGPPVTLSDAHASAPAFTAPEGLTHTSVTFQVAVSDGTHAAVDAVMIDIDRDNDAPITSAGPDQVLRENDVVVLAGSAVDPEGQALTYLWTQKNGPRLALSDFHASAPTFTAPEGLKIWRVTFELAASDGTNTSEDTVIIEIRRINDAPKASAGPDQTVDESDLVALASTGADPEGEPLTYTWTQIAGPPVALSDIHASDPTFVAPEGLTNTSVTFELAISDGSNTVVDTVAIGILRDDDPPTAIAGEDRTVGEGLVITLAGSGIDLEGQPVTYSWTQTAGPPVALSSASSATATFLAPEGVTSTSVTFQLAVSDGRNTSLDTVTIALDRDDDPPIASAGPDQTVNDHDLITLAGASFDAEGQALSCVWSQTAGSPVTLSDVHVASPTFQAPQSLSNASYTFQFAVTDGKSTSVDTVTIEVVYGDDPPSAQAGLDQIVNENDLVTLAGSGVDPEGQALEHSWMQTSGPPVTLSDARAPAPTFKAPEGLANTSATFQLTVSDGGATGVDTVVVEIRCDNDAPTASAGPDQTGNETDVVTLGGSGVDPEGQALTYSWTQTAGPAVQLSDSNSPKPTFTAPDGLANANLTFQLTVSDGSSMGVDLVTIAINRDDDPPRASAGTNQAVSTNEVVSLAGSGVDPEGQALTYSWSQIAGPSVKLNDIKSKAPKFTAPECPPNTSLTFQLAVSDGTNTRVDLVTIVINRDDALPPAGSAPNPVGRSPANASAGASNLSPGTARQYFETADYDGDGWITIREATASMELDRRSFALWDQDGDGRISPDEFRTRYEKILRNGGAFSAPLGKDDPARGGTSAAGERPPRQGRGADQTLDRSELRTFLAKRKSRLDPDVVMSKFDRDGSQRLEQDEAADLTAFLDPARRSRPPPRVSSVEELFGKRFPRDEREGATPLAPRIAGPVPLFRRLDPVGGGRITSGDLIGLGNPIQFPIRIAAVFAALDTNGDGAIDGDEFRVCLTGR